MGVGLAGGVVNGVVALGLAAATGAVVGVADGAGDALAATVGAAVVGPAVVGAAVVGATVWGGGGAVVGATVGGGGCGVEVGGGGVGGAVVAAAPATVIVPVMKVWIAQWYWYVPATVKANVFEDPGLRTPVSNVPVFDVAVCASPPLFVHVTLSPALIVSVRGTKLKSTMLTACVAPNATADTSRVAVSWTATTAARPRTTRDLIPTDTSGGRSGITRDAILRTMRIMVTGGAGFIGSSFIRRWLGEHPSDSAVNVDLLTYAGDRTSLADVERAYGDRYAFVRADIADATAMRDAFSAHRPSIVVNFAAESHNSRAVLDPAAFVRTNVVGTQTLLDAAKTAGVERFHHISTCEVYGDLALDSRESFREDSPYRPRTPYNASKAAADHLVRAYGETFGLPITISNCSNNYGPYQYPEKVIPLFATNAMDDRPLPLYRHSENRREWIHVDDHCRAVALVLERGRVGETYNVGTGDERSIEQVADAVLATLGKPASLKTYVEDRPGHDRRYLLDHAKIERDLGWKPEIGFADGLRATVEWYASHPAWWEPKRAALAGHLDERGWSASGRPGG